MPKMWRENPACKESPTVGTVVIHSTDKILDVDIYQLVIRHVSAWGAYGQRPAFMPCVCFIGHPPSVCENGNVHFGDNLLPFLKAESEGLTILQKHLEKIGNPQVKQRISGWVRTGQECDCGGKSTTCEDCCGSGYVLIEIDKAVKKAEVPAVVMVPRKPVEEFAAELSDAYSTGNYKGGWGPVIKALRRCKYTDPQIEAIIRSKWTRWASDTCKTRRKATARTLLRWMRNPLNDITYQEIVDLTVETFDGNVAKAMMEHA